MGRPSVNVRWCWGPIVDDILASGELVAFFADYRPAYGPS
jgi:hypothetical protein